jgi:uncharacterized protein
VFYLDTSFVAPLFIPEETSRDVAAFFRGLPAGELAVSHWTAVEFSSMMARRARASELTAKEAARADSRFDAAIGSSFVVFLPGADDFALARRFIQRLETGLRAPDALHLAIAANRDAQAILSLDKRLIAASRILGLPGAHGIGFEG